MWTTDIDFSGDITSTKASSTAYLRGDNTGVSLFGSSSATSLGANVQIFVSSHSTPDLGKLRIGTTSKLEWDSNKVTINDVLNLTPRSSDPSSPSNGDIWYNSTSGTFKCYANGATETIAFV